MLGLYNKTFFLDNFFNLLSKIQFRKGEGWSKGREMYCNGTECWQEIFLPGAARDAFSSFFFALFDFASKI